ncbi:hypothetical protein Landi51_00584 [Colletotrichum acutatum]
MDESAELIKSLTDTLDAINKVQAQQSKAFSALAKLRITKDAPAADVSRQRDLQGELATETQETLANVVSLQIKIMKQHAAKVLSRQQAVAMPPKQQEQKSACDSRVFEPYDIGEVLMLRKPFRPPAILAVCKESREVANEHGSFAFGWGNTIGGSTWFNPKKDVVIIDDPEIYGELEPTFDQCQAEILAFNWDYFRSDEELEHFWHCVRDVESCRRVMILYRSPSNYAYRKGKSPKLFALQPSDAIWGSGMMNGPFYLPFQEEITWQEVKDKMEYLWRVNHDEDEDEDETFPSLEGMELIMCKED